MICRICFKKYRYSDDDDTCDECYIKYVKCDLCNKKCLLSKVCDKTHKVIKVCLDCYHK
jgi:hypothetical protein